jgi:hypothetical protein
MFTANAQLDCNYRLEMYDSFGDGWNGASIDLSVAGTSTNYTVNFADNNGDFNIVTIPVTESDAITLNYTGGTFENEVTYILFDSEDNVVFSDGPFPATGLVFEGTAACPSCPKIEAESISFTQTPGGAVVTWDEAAVAGDYVIEYGPFGFTPGSGTTETVTTNSLTLSGLASGEILDFYIYLDCGGGDLSSTTGPVFVQAGYIDTPLECTFVLELVAENGFGWGNASIDVTVNNVTTTYTVAFDDNNGDFLLIDLPIQSGALITLDYNGDQFDDDNLYRLLSPEGQELFDSGANPDSGIGFQEIVFCPTCPAIDPESITVVQVPGGFDVTWAEGQLPGDYIIEYGPLGFEQGTGTFETVSTNAWSLTGQTEGDLFNFYVTLDCGDDDTSFPIGPNFAQAGYTNPPAECSYTLEMLDSFGDGWNGAAVTITINGISTEYTVTNADNNGDFLIVDIAVVDGALVTLDYSPGTFENEVTYNLYDTDGIAVFSDGPFPLVGEAVYQGVATCPPCPLPMQSSFIADPIGGTSATINWSVVSPAVSYTIEYGPNCFEPGEGIEMVVTTNSAELTDLEENTFYSYYVTGDCGAEGLSNTAGPFFFETTPECFPPSDPAILLVDVNDASISITQNPNTENYVIEYGPVGFALGGGFTTAPFSGNLGIINDLEPNTTYQYFVYGDCGSAQSEAVGPLFFTTDLPCPPITDFTVTDITDNSAELSWSGAATAIGYTLEIGHAGFEVGSGIITSSTDPNISLIGLNPGVAYDVYVTSDCDVDGMSIAAGPFSFGTTGGNTCTFTLEMNDSFGDGWNGANITVMSGDVTQVFTVNFDDNNGDFNIVEFEVTGGLPLILTYAPGTFENEVSYILYDSSGEIILENGPFPPVGEIYNEIALCSGGAGCSVPFAEVSNVRAVTADIDWLSSADASGYTVEWGPVGFSLGTGTTAMTTDTSYTITGLTPNTWYNAYVTPDCEGTGTEFSFGPLAFETYIINDVGISGFASPTNLDCVLGEEDISVLIQNYGQNPQQLIPFFYSLDFANASINNPVDGLFTGVVSKDSSEVIDFDNTFDFSEPGYYYFEAWTEMEGDENTSNDTFTYELITAYPLPLNENFNNITQDSGLPDDWSSPNGVPVLAPGDDPHGLTSTIIGGELNDNFFGGGPIDTIEFTIARYGLMESTSELTFDYRFVTADFNGNVSSYPLDADDLITVDVSTDCGENWEELLVVGAEDPPNTILFKEASASLGDYEGEAISIRFRITNGLSGDFFADIDNINIAGCPDNLFIQIDQSDPVSFGTGNGVMFAQPTFGVAPFSFEWSNGQTTAVADGLGFTDYSVTVTDANGCQSIRNFETSLTDTEDPIVGFESLSLAPNPTTGMSQLQVSLEEAADIEVQVFDLAGRLIQTLNQDNQLSTTFNLDLSDQANGMYLVRLQAGGATQVMKLAIAK